MLFLCVLTCGWSCRPPGGRWRSRNGLSECRGAPWRPLRSFCWPQVAPPWLRAQNTALQRPSGRPQSLEERIRWVEEQVKPGRVSRCDGRSRTCSQRRLWPHHDEPHLVILTELSQDGVVANGNLCMRQRFRLIFWKIWFIYTEE